MTQEEFNAQYDALAHDFARTVEKMSRESLHAINTFKWAAKELAKTRNRLLRERDEQAATYQLHLDILTRDLETVFASHGRLVDELNETKAKLFEAQIKISKLDHK